MITAKDNYVFFVQNVLHEHMQTMVVYLQKLMKTLGYNFVLEISVVKKF